MQAASAPDYTVSALAHVVLCPRREAKARTSNAQAGDRDFLDAACHFLPACAEHQVRLAPDKCECACRSCACGSHVSSVGGLVAHLGTGSRH